MPREIILKKGKTSINFGPDTYVFPDGYAGHKLSRPGIIEDMAIDIEKDLMEQEDKFKMLAVYSPVSVNDMQDVATTVYHTLESLEANMRRYSVLAVIKAMMQEGFKVEYTGDDPQES